MRKTLSILILAAMVLTGCIREEDRDLLRNPIHVSGTIDPEFGFPVADDQMTISDVIRLFNGADRFINPDANNEFINLSFDTSLTNVIDCSALSKKKARSRVKSGTFVYDTIISGVQELNFFNDQDVLNGISVSKVMADWIAAVTINASDEFVGIAANRDVNFSINDIVIKAFGYNNQSVTININEGQTVSLNELILGHADTIQILNHQDLGQLADLAPTRISYSFNLHLSIGDAFLTNDIHDILVDSLQIRTIDLESFVSVDFPVNVSVDYLVHTVDTINFNIGDKLDSILNSLNSQDNYDIDLKESNLIFRFDNGLPFDLKVNAELLDEHNQKLFLLTDSANSVLVGAPIVPSASDPSIYVTNGTSPSQLDIILSTEQLKKIADARHVVITIVANTSSSNGTKPHVAPRMSDKLGIKLYLKLHPSLTFDIPLSGGVDINMKKGGLK